jgi:ABC-2 type transport system ATP-binding protein
VIPDAATAADSSPAPDPESSPLNESVVPDELTAPRPDPVGGAAEPDERELIVEMHDVDKAFERVPALSKLSILAPKGRITVLLGPNGAGKTTAIRVITGALTPDRGRVRTFGYDPNRFGEGVRRRCGVVSAKPALYDRLSGWDNLQYAAELYGLGRNAIRPIRDAAGRFGIVDALDQRVGGYSTGMKTRLALSRAVLHDPELLLFDEPTSGLDPESSHAVLELIREMTADSHTVVMCTHLLVEAEGLADQIVVLENGTDLIHGTQEELTARYWPGNLVRFAAEDNAQLALLADAPGVLSLDHIDGVVEARLDDVARVPDLVSDLAASGVRLTRVDPHNPSLEDLYFAIRRERRGDAGTDGVYFPEIIHRGDGSDRS